MLTQIHTLRIYTHTHITLVIFSKKKKTDKTRKQKTYQSKITRKS